MTSPLADPPVRPDGRCAVCPKLRDPAQSSRYARHEAALDPFCSATCARVFHGTSLPEPVKGGARPKIQEAPVVEEPQPPAEPVIEVALVITPEPAPGPDPEPEEVLEPNDEPELAADALVVPPPVVVYVSADEVRERGYVTFVAKNGESWPISVRPGEYTPYPRDVAA